MHDSTGSAPASRSEQSDLPFVPPWLAFALGEIGTREAPGDFDNPRIRQYHGATRGGESPDALPWCASFVNWCLKQAGRQGTGTKRARDFLQSEHFERLERPRLGCIVILERGNDPNAGHATLYLGAPMSGWIVCLGGNQQNEVGCNEYASRRVLAYLWPKGA